MALAHELRSSALGFDGLFDRQRIIGFVGVNLAGLFRDGRRSDSNIGLIGRRRLNRADDSRVLVCSNMRLIAMRGRTRAVLHPGGLFVPFGCRADHGRVDQRALADNGTL